MKRRKIIGASGFIALGLFLLFMLPATPAGRSWLLGRAETALGNYGATLDYRNSSGNPWWGFSLEEATLQAPGIDLALGRLDLSYRLLSIIRGRLPLSVRAEALTGTLHLAQIDLRPQGGRSLPIRPVLQELDVEQVDLKIDDVPYTLPDLAISDVKIAEAAGGFALDATLSTTEGAAEVAAVIRLQPWSLRAEVKRADAALVRHWWRGARAGTLTGTITIEENDVRAELELVDGKAALPGITLTSISGPISYRPPFVEAELTAEVLGGTASTVTRVNVTEKHLEAEVTGRGGLAELAALLTTRGMPPDLLPTIAPEGHLDMKATVSGWEQIEVLGEARGSGTLLERPLGDLLAIFSFSSESGPSVSASASLGEGQIALSLTPNAEGMVIDFGAEAFRLTDTLVAGAHLSLQTAAGASVGSGSLDATLTGTALSRPRELAIDGTIEDTLWRFHATGTDELGAMLESTFTIDDNQVSGAAELGNLSLPFASAPLALTLHANGPLDTVPLTTTLSSATPIELVFGDTRFPIGTEGELRAVLKGAVLTALTGEVGPLSVAGTMDIGHREGELQLELEETPLSGPLRGTLGFQNGTLAITPEKTRLEADLTFEAGSLNTVTLPNLSGLLELINDDTTRLSFKDVTHGLEVDLNGDRLGVRLEETPFDVAGQTLTLTGDITTTPATPLEAMALDLRAATPQGELSVRGDADLARLEFRADPGQPIGPFTLEVGTELDGELKLRDRRLMLAGTLGEIIVELGGGLNLAGGTKPVLDTELELMREQEHLILTVQGPVDDLSWSTSGQLSLTALGSVLGLELSGELSGSFSSQGGLHEGDLILDGRFRDQLLTAHLTGSGETVSIEAETILAGRELRLDGTVLPALGGQLELASLATLRIASEGSPSALVLSGEGLLGPIDLGGFRIEEQPLALRAELGEGRARFDAGDSQAQLRWDAEGWSLESQLSQAAAWQELSALVKAQLNLDSARPAGTVSGTISLTAGSESDPASTVLDLDGTLDELVLTGTLPSQLLTSAVPSAEVELLGDLEVRASLGLRAGNPFALTASWHSPLEQALPLDVVLSTESGNVRIDLSSEELEGHAIWGEERTFSVKATAFDPSPFVSSIAGVELAADLSGELSYDTREAVWQGELAAEIDRPVETSLKLSGRGPELSITGLYTSGPLELSATGQLFPALGVTVNATGFEDRFNLEGYLSGTADQARFEGSLTNRAFETDPEIGLSIPAQTARLTVDWPGTLDALTARIEGGAVRLDLSEGQWSSGEDLSLELPFSLKGEPHTLLARVSGPMLDPKVHGRLAGMYAEGPFSASLTGVQASPTLKPTPWMPPPLQSLEGFSIHTDVTLDPALGWSAVMNGAATLPGRTSGSAIPLTLNATVTGQRSLYQAEGQLGLGNDLIPLSLRSDETSIQLTAETETLSLTQTADYLGLPLTGHLSGRAELDFASGATNEQLTFSVDLAGSGTFQNRVFDLVLAAHQENGLQVDGKVAGLGISLEADWPTGRIRGPHTLALNLQDPDDPGNTLATATIETAFDPPFSFTGSGHYRDQNLVLSGSFDPAARAGTWSVDVADVSVTGLIEPGEDGHLNVQSSLQAPQGIAGLPGEPLAATLEGGIRNGELRVARFAVEAGEGFSLNASGRAWPQPALQGDAHWLEGLPETTIFSLTGQAEGYRLNLEQQSLELEVDLSPRFQVLNARAVGDLAIEGLPTPDSHLTTEADLSWSAANGFTGRADLRLEPLAETRLELHLIGRGVLQVTGESYLRDQGVATAELILSDAPWLDRNLSGTVILAAELPPLIPELQDLPLAQDLTAAGTFEIGGNLTDPRISGPVSLGGMVPAQGQLEASREQASVRLEGRGLSASAEVDAEGWRLEAELTELDLTQLERIEAARLTGALSGHQDWGQPPIIRLESFTLASADSNITGHLTYHQGLHGTLELGLNLADLDLDTQSYRGTIRGPLTLELTGEGEKNRSTLQRVNLSGALRAEGLGLTDSDWGLGGNVTIEGSLASPSIELELAGEGSASGELRASATPQLGNYRLTGGLSVGSLKADAELTLQAGTLQGNGSLAWDEYRFDIAAGDEPGRLMLVGKDLLSGWQGEVDIDGQQLDLRGEFTDLTPGAGRLADLHLNWQQGVKEWITGELTELAFNDISLGDLTISSEATEAERLVLVEGEALKATLSLLGYEVGWELERLGVSLPGEVTLQAQGGGTLSQADLRGQLRGTLFEEEIDLPFTSRYQAGEIRLDADTSLLGGNLSMAARHQSDTGWQGHLELDGIQLQGTMTNLDGDFSGLLTEPKLTGRLTARQGSTELSGEFTLSRTAMHLTQQLASPLLVEPLLLEGRLWPELTLTASTVDGNRLEVSQTGSDTGTAYISDGVLELAVGPAAVRLRPTGRSGEWLEVALALPSVEGLAFVGVVPEMEPGEWFTSLRNEGWRLTGTETTSGDVTLTVENGISLALEELNWRGEAGALQVSGQVYLGDGVDGQLTGRWRFEHPPESALLPWLDGLETWPFEAILTGTGALLNADSALGKVTATIDWQDDLNVQATADLVVGDGKAQLDLGYDATEGPSGKVVLTAVPLLTETVEGATTQLDLSGTLALGQDGIRGEGGVNTPLGEVALEGQLGWARIVPTDLQTRYLPSATNLLEIETHLDGFDLAELPLVAKTAPNLTAPLSGTLQLSNESVSGVLESPELTVLDLALPARLELTGNLARLEAVGTLGRSELELSYQDGIFAGLINWMEFPLHSIAAAALGDPGATATVTGSTRFEIPLGQPAESSVRIATERIQLEYGDQVTLGNLSASYDGGDWIIDNAEFRGEGTWQANGSFTTETLDLSVTAQDADFSPLLRLIPSLSTLDLEVRGSFSANTRGNLGKPQIEAQSPALEIRIGGSNYRLEQMSLTLEDDLLQGTAQLNGVSPLTGALEFHGSGFLELRPFRAEGLSLTFSGAVTVPTIGEIQEVNGSLIDTPAGWQLTSTGRMGQVFELNGSLTPLDLHLSGTELNLKIPDYYLSSSDIDADLWLRLVGENYIISGEVFDRRAELALGSERQVTVRTDEENTMLSRILFDNIRIKAPGQIFFQESFGSAEIGADVVLGGSAAAPELKGRAQTLRGLVRFSGREFTINEATATFQPSRGALPVLTVTAETNFEKISVLRGSSANRFTFVTPSNSPTLKVFLTLSGEFEKYAPGENRLHLTPTLSSNATIREEASRLVRPLNEQELITMLSLGRLEIASGVATQGGLAGTVAESALDTAVELTVLSEVQQLLGDMLGIDLVEIDTILPSSFLQGSGASEFGVSLRLGAYINQETFTSFKIGTNELYALSNEFNVRYDFDKFALNLRSTVNLPRQEELSAQTELDLLLGYEVTQLISFETGFNLAPDKQGFSIGLSFRW
ncbi:MAG: translocation/assembly module TamB domain-containing protein [Trueperaceae bacterium]|nr:MAG: translocation/assembly module TamB domain-containing protein [Trueperaceae bacterium]